MERTDGEESNSHSVSASNERVTNIGRKCGVTESQFAIRDLCFELVFDECSNIPAYKRRAHALPVKGRECALYFVANVIAAREEELHPRSRLGKDVTQYRKDSCSL